MANWTILKAAITNAIKTNGNQEITGQLLQNTLNSIVNAIGENRTFVGIASRSTSPGTFDGPVFYIATTTGIYTNFNGLSVINGEIALFVNNTSNTWNKISVTSTNSSSPCEINLTPFFIKKAYFKSLENSYTPGEEVHSDNSTITNEFDCISIKVKAGDYFIPQNILGGANQARAYTLYDETGTRLFLADANTLLNDRIDIEQDGYIVFQTYGSYNYSLYGYFNFFNNWNWQYIVPIMKNIDSLISFSEITERSTGLIKNDLYGIDLTVSKDWDKGYIRTNYNNIGAGLNGKVNFDEVITTYSYYHHKIIACKPGDKFTVHIKGGAVQGRAWNFLYKDKRVISQSSEDTYIDLELTAPDEAAYLVLNANTNDSTVVGALPIWQLDKNKDIKQIKILCFGNSFTQDSMSYVPFILKNLAPNVKLTLGIAYIGGCPLVQHLANFTGEDQVLNGVVYTQTNYTYYKSINGEAWISNGSKNVNAMLADEKWDIITFQQNGGAAYQDWDIYFAPFIFKLHKSLFDKMGYGIKLGWILTQGAYASDYENLLNHWQGTANNSKKVLETTGTSILFPFGTAVQNLRTTSLKEIGDGEAHNLMADSGHLQDGIGCMTAAYANIIVILNYLGIYKTGVIGEQTRVNSAFITEKNIPGPHLGTSGVVGVTNDNCYLAQVAAECAIKKPYEVTDLTDVESGI